LNWRGYAGQHVVSPVRRSLLVVAEALDLSLTPAVLERYRAAFGQWRERLEQTISRGGAGQYSFSPVRRILSSLSRLIYGEDP
jgi:hypothetical protein